MAFFPRFGRSAIRSGRRAFFSHPRGYRPRVRRNYSTMIRSRPVRQRAVARVARARPRRGMYDSYASGVRRSSNRQGYFTSARSGGGGGGITLNVPSSSSGVPYQGRVAYPLPAGAGWKRTEDGLYATRVVSGRGPNGGEYTRPETVAIAPFSVRHPWAYEAASTAGDLAAPILREAAKSVLTSAVDTAKNFFTKYVGLGDYHTPTYNVSRNSLFTGPPYIANKNSIGEFTVTHREYITDIKSHRTPNTFNLEAYQINPGRSECFPWLAQIARAYQEYRIDGMIFEYRTMSADALNSTNTALGQVIMATNYDVMRADFTRKYEMENTEYASSCKPSRSMLHPIECSRRQTVMNELYVATDGVIPMNAIPQLYDFGKFQIATNGVQGSEVNLGELWVTYQITFFKPIAHPTAGTASVDPEIPSFNIDNRAQNGGPCGVIARYCFAHNVGEDTSNVLSKVTAGAGFPMSDGSFMYPLAAMQKAMPDGLVSTEHLERDQYHAYFSTAGITLWYNSANPDRIYFGGIESVSGGLSWRPYTIPPDWDDSTWLFTIGIRADIEATTTNTFADFVTVSPSGGNYLSYNAFVPFAQTAHTTKSIMYQTFLDCATGGGSKLPFVTLAGGLFTVDAASVWSVTFSLMHYKRTPVPVNIDMEDVLP